MGKNSPLHTNKAPSVLVFAVSCILALFAWRTLIQEHKEDQLELIEQQAQAFSSYIAGDLSASVPALQRIVHRWQARGGTPQIELVEDALHYIDDYQGIQAIEWIDPSYITRWVIPKLGNESDIDRDLGADEEYSDFLDAVRKAMIPTMTNPVELDGGGMGVVFLIPIQVGDRFDGFLKTVFRTQDWLEQALRNSRSLHEFKDYEIAISIDGIKVFETRNFSKTPYKDWQVSKQNTFYNHEFEIFLVPTEHMFNNSERITAEMVALAFLLFGLILSLTVYYLQKASLASREMEKTNKILADESRDRLIAEKQANAANEAKTKFLAAMSHEIRTPLNAVLGILQLLENRALPEDVTKKLKTAQHSGVFLLALVNQVLDFARIEAGAVEIEEEDFTVGSLVADLHSLFSVQSETKKLSFEYKINGPDALWMTACYGHIKQILFNLIGNAIKFTQEGAVRIDVDIEEGSLNTYHLIFNISDTGPGISEEEQELIFEAFKQSETGRTSSMGTGLGLSISRNLVEMMGGYLTVSSEVGKGTTFTLKIGARLAKEQLLAGLSDQDESPVTSLRILVAEDNNINQMIIREMLQGDGHSVKLVENGAEAVEEIRQNRQDYDLIFMDIQMPVMTGVEAAGAIRMLVPDKDVLPIYALTANAFESQVEEYKSVGMHGALTKPIDRPVLRETLLEISKKVVEKNCLADPQQVLPMKDGTQG